MKLIKSFRLCLSFGITSSHPVFSITYNDWQLAGELEAGENVLTYHGEATVTSNEKKEVSRCITWK